MVIELGSELFSTEVRTSQLMVIPHGPPMLKATNIKDLPEAIKWPSGLETNIF
jgi:hypothetical protein